MLKTHAAKSKVESEGSFPEGRYMCVIDGGESDCVIDAL